MRAWVGRDERQGSDEKRVAERRKRMTGNADAENVRRKKHLVMFVPVTFTV